MNCFQYNFIRLHDLFFVYFDRQRMNLGPLAHLICMGVLMAVTGQNVDVRRITAGKCVLFIVFDAAT